MIRKITVAELQDLVRGEWPDDESHREAVLRSIDRGEFTETVGYFFGTMPVEVIP